jgi:hypothetical protein
LRLAKAEREAVDHIAAPLGPARLDTGTTERRFIHRSIREHLVAEQVIGLSVEQAAETLLPHLWYDPDWDYSAPAAIANHPQKDQLLRHLIARALRCQPNGSGIIDASWEFRGLLARVACESNEADWSPDVAAIIGQARVELASSFHFDWQTFPLIGAGRWDASNRQANAALLRLLPGSEGLGSVLLVDWVVQLATTAEDKRQARGALLAILDDETDRSMAIWLFFVGVVKLVTTIEDKRQVRETLLAMLADTSEPSVRDFAEGLAKGVVELDATVDEKRQVREALLAIIDADRMHGNVGGQAQGVRRTARDAGRREPRLDGAVRPPMSWSTGSHGSPQQRTKSARPETRYSGGWPTRRTALRRNYWWTGSPGSWRVRRTSARPAKRYSRCCPM